MTNHWRIEPSGAAELGPCADCGMLTMRVWGYVWHLDATEAAYFVEWTTGGVPQHGAHIDLIVGRWGENTTSKDRFSVALEFRWFDGRPEFMVIDSVGRSVATSELVGRALNRSDVIGTPLAQQIFDMVDAVWLQDLRIAEVTRRI